MARYKFPNTEPPGGWKYLQKETRLVIKGDSLGELITRVKEHRLHKKLEPTDDATIRLEIERQICTRLGKRECRAEGVNDEWMPIDFSSAMYDLNALLAFSKAALGFIASGAEMVPMEEVERRAAICRDCPLNTPATGCKCSLFYKAIDAVVPQSRKPDGLYICAACQCSIPAKIQLPLSLVAKSNEGRKIDFPVFCWQNASHEGQAAD